jgi:molecular chaperone DnaK (HSP70)
VWSDAAKAATLQAAKEAGLFPVSLIKEPEAAALHTLKDLSFALKPGQAFVICDAGGGTVDLISYEVEKITPRLTLKEIVPGTGGMAGSLGLNRRFEEAVKTLIGEEELFRVKKTKGWIEASTQFDRDIKRKFRGKSTEEHFVHFPMADLEDDPDNRLESNSWTMTGDDLKEIFEPLVDDVIRLIEDQVKSVRLKHEYTLSGIMLVGGFGSSQYLKDCVKRKFPDIQVMQPQDAWSAIVRGAALSKVPNSGVMVQSTVATHHYGVVTWNEFEPGLDDGEVTQVHRDGVLRVERFTWFISIGEELDRDHSIKHAVYRDFELDPPADKLIVSDQLWECSDVEQPRHVSKGHKLKPNSKVSADLRSVPKEKYKRKTRARGAP